MLAEMSGADDKEARGEGEDAAAYCTRMAQSILSTLNIPALGPGAVDLSIEASGAPSCVQMGIQVLKPAYVLTLHLVSLRERSFHLCCVWPYSV